MGVTAVFHPLDDPRPLPPSTGEQRQATMRRGESLRRRRRARLVAVPAALALAAAVVGSFAWSSLKQGSQPLLAGSVAPSSSVSAAPSEPPPSALPMEGDRDAAAPANSVCSAEAAGDSEGAPDLTFAALDRPTQPFFHMSWDGKFPRNGAAEIRISATSADRERIRLLVVEIVDRQVVGQFVRDPRTGDQQTVIYDAPTSRVDDQGNQERVAHLTSGGLGVEFPGAATRPLGDGWVWELSIRVDGVLVDSCLARKP